MFRETFDAVIVGARCAGAATARLMADAGMRVLVVDRAEKGSDTVSSHVLTRGAVNQLHRWGLLDTLRAAGTPDICETMFQFGDEQITIKVASPDGLPGLIAPRRTVLDPILVDAAQAAGAEFRYKTAFRGAIRDEAGRVTGVRLSDANGTCYEAECGLLVGADGVRSSVVRDLKVPFLEQTDDCLGHVYGYFAGMEGGSNLGYHVTGTSVGITPTNHGAHCVIVSARPGRVRAAARDMGTATALIELAATANAALGDELRAAQLTEPPILFAGVPGYYRQCAGPGWALVGDAGYFRDPVTSHGITDAFCHAELLAMAAINGRDGALAAYQAARNDVTREIFDLTAQMTRFDGPMSALKGEFQALSKAMKAEQAWMADAFQPHAVAA